MSSQPEDINNGLWKQEEWRIFRNALPLHSQRIDITHLEGDFAYSLIENLLQGRAFEMTTAPPFSIAQELQSLYFESRASERVRGNQPFGLGFPLFLAKDSQGETIAAPIFLWNLSIEPSPRHIGRWLISRKPFQKLVFNRFLAAYWDQSAGTALTADFEAALASGNMDARLLARLCNDAVEKLGMDSPGQGIAVSPTPTVEELGRLLEQPCIQWSGVLGLYRPHQHLFSSPGTGATEKDSKPPVAHTLGLLPLDPHQAAASAAVFEKEATLVAGLAGTGRTHLALHLLTNALANGQRCLAVSPRLPALRSIQQRLEQLGLGRLSFLLRDTNQDLPLFMEITRAAANAKEPEISYSHEQYRLLSARAERLKRKLDDSYLSTRALAFGPYNWTETVGLYLKSIRKEGKELLATQLNAQDYRFSYEEYQKLSQAIVSCQELLGEANVLRSPLNQLHQGVFLRMDKEEALDFIEEKTEALLSRALSLRQWYINRINTYSELLSAHYEQYYQDYARRLALLSDRLAEYCGRFGEAFESSGMGGLKIKSVFSETARAILEARQSVAAGYEKLRSEFEGNPYFEYVFLPANEGRDVLQVKESLKGFEQALARWRSGLRDAVQDEIQRLSHKTVHPRLGFKEQVVELEDGLDRLLDQVNESGLYHLPISHKSLVIPKRQRFLDELVEQLEVTRRSLREFDAFYDWQNNWLQLSESARRLVKALIKGRPQDWKAAFESWFLDNCLSQAYKAVLPPEPGHLEELARTLEQFKPLLLPHALLLWRRQKGESLRRLRRQDRAAFQMIGGKQQEADPAILRDHLRRAVDAASAMMPVLLATPQVAGECFAGTGFRFDYVIVEDASFLNPREVRMLKELGRQSVFLGNALPEGSLKTPPSYEYLMKTGAEARQLYHCHHHFPGNLARFQAEEEALPFQLEEPLAFRFEQLDGRYDEQTEANEEEALHIIGLLNKIEKTPQRTYPSVGIACLTKGQRDMIASYLLHIKQRRSTGVEIIQQLERNGLSVLCLSELAGQRFDILILSGSLGAIDLQGSVTGHIHRLRQDRVLESLFTLMSTAEKRVHIVNSIPLPVLEELASDPESRELYLLAAYFLYIKAGSEQDRETAAGIVEGLPGWMHFRSPFRHPWPFFEEVGQRLQPYLGPGRVQIDNSLAPLKIQASGPEQRPLYIAPDGFLAQALATDYQWEYEQSAALGAIGYRPVPAWSADWWRNPDLEAKRMASLVIRLEQQALEEEE
ncbi:MAG: hypothetical protein H6557_32710 [Lewinellaceae bacterium]|nr:hypothetical protein [Phaeodactylibacter sp.]MCB9041407.1 hypothetical protein [Lewinellaceae bacterium]